MKQEDEIQIAFCEYMDWKHPDVIYFANGEGIKMTIGQAVKAKRMGQIKKGLPDVFIVRGKMGWNIFQDGVFEVPGAYLHGAFLEIKTDRSQVYKKNGDMRSNKHVKEQNHMLEMLKREGYFAEFAFGLDHLIQLTDWYLN